MEEFQFQTWPSSSSFTNYNPSLSFSTSSSSISQEDDEEEETPTISTSFNSLQSSKLDNNNNINTSLITPKKLIIALSAKMTSTQSQIINCLAVRDNALYAATAREVNVYDPNTLRLTGTLGPGSGLAKSIAFGGDDKIFTAHQDRKIRVWNKNHRLVSTLPTLKDRARNCMLPKNYVRVRRHEQRLWIEHADAVSGLAVDGNFMYSVSWDKCLKIWRLSKSSSRCLESVEAHSDAVNCVVVGPVDGRVYTGSADGEIKIWGGETRRRGYELVATVRGHGSSVNALALTGGDGSGGLCSGGGDGVILVWENDDDDVKNGGGGYSVGCCLEGHKGAVLCLVHVKGVLVSGSSDTTVRIWGFGGKDDGDGFRGCLAILEGHCKPVKALVAMELQPDDDDDDDLDDGLSIFSGSLDGEIRAWKIKTISHPTI